MVKKRWIVCDPNAIDESITVTADESVAFQLVKLFKAWKIEAVIYHPGQYVPPEVLKCL